MQCMSNKVSVQEKMDKEGRPVLVVFMLGAGEGQRRDRRIMTPDDAKMVVELVKVRYRPLLCALEVRKASRGGAALEV